MDAARAWAGAVPDAQGRSRAAGRVVGKPNCEETEGAAWILLQVEGSPRARWGARGALATRPRRAPVRSRVASGWLGRSGGREVQKEAGAEAGAESGKRRHTSGGTSERSRARAQSPRVRPGWKCPSHLLLGPQFLSSLLPLLRQRALEGFARGRGRGRPTTDGSPLRL